MPVLAAARKIQRFWGGRLFSSKRKNEGFDERIGSMRGDFLRKDGFSAAHK